MPKKRGVRPKRGKVDSKSDSKGDRKFDREPQKEVIVPENPPLYVKGENGAVDYEKLIADKVLVWACECGQIEQEGSQTGYMKLVRDPAHKGEGHKLQLINKDTEEVVAESITEARGKNIYPAPPIPPPASPGGDGNLSFKGGLVDLPTAWPAEALVYYNMVIQFGLESGDMTFQEWAFKCMDWAMTGHYGVELVLRHVDERKTLAPELKEAIEASVQKVMAASKGKK